MAASSYGAYQPGAVDPWPIESVLAKEQSLVPLMHKVCSAVMLSSVKLRLHLWSRI
jgi:hypothetical protein